MLNNIRYYTSSLLTNYKFFLIVGLVAIFIGVAIYGYYKYVSPKLKPAYVPNNEFVENEELKEAELMFFYTTWCPHCKTAKPIWESFKEDNQNTLFNGHRIIFREIDCDKEEDLAKEYGIEGYPTIKLIKNGQVIEYDAKPDKDTLHEFLETAL